MPNELQWVAANIERLKMKTYTAQANKFGNVIVCGDEIARNTYRIIFTGTYNECMAIKFGGAKVSATNEN